ncbi:paraquat-inducible protein A [Marinobacterium sedimentorum]|uniref:paraquat-inducible protein A n=1 Tax=Marinobacterium sedimentorum TaxID=2927804 RepID=UPI0020C73697|nr:paraquat-inducible protein A [Marinobacterium sedimentorum]MCP8690229.1 paraquat-inducible protein A [Marinobacterium sedimentorum]
MENMIACHDCDLLLSRPRVPPGSVAQCPRCGSTLIVRSVNSIERTLALAIAGLILFVPANLYPLLTLEALGIRQSQTVFSSAMSLYNDGLWLVALLILLFAILVPLVKLLLLLYISASLHGRRFWRGTALALRSYQHLDEWGMLEVYLLGVAVSVVKLVDVAAIEPGLGLYSLVALILVTLLSSTQLNRDLFWHLIGERQSHPQPDFGQHDPTAAAPICCHDCSLLCPPALEGTPCPRCHAKLHARTPNSLSWTWALLVSALFLLLPANLLPIMTIRTLGRGDPSTIIEGVIELTQHGLFWIALVVLIASVIIPVGKLIGMFILLLSVQLGWTTNLRQKMLMFRFVEWVGRWSMLDIFVVGILVALVQLGNLTHIIGNHGATAFATVVICTMVAAQKFDTRLIWDRHLETSASDQSPPTTDVCEPPRS